MRTLEAFLLNPFVGLGIAAILVVIGWKLNASGAEWLLFLAWSLIVVSVFRTPPIARQVFIQRALWTMLIASGLGLGLCWLAGWQPTKNEDLSPKTRADGGTPTTPPLGTIFLNPQPAVKTTIVPQPTTPLEKPPTLADLFARDFPNVMKVSNEAASIEWTDGMKLPIKRQVYLDFPTRTQFVGFYIPWVPSNFPTREYEACLRLADLVQSTIDDLPKRMSVSAGDVGGNTRMQELVFSGRVFLYHEQPLSNIEKAEITKAYYDKKFDVQFRGPQYLGPSLETWHQQHRY